MWKRKSLDLGIVRGVPAVLGEEVLVVIDVVVVELAVVAAWRRYKLDCVARGMVVMVVLNEVDTTKSSRNEDRRQLLISALCPPQTPTTE